MDANSIKRFAIGLLGGFVAGWLIWCTQAHAASVDLQASNPAITGYWSYQSGKIRLPESTVASLPAASSNTGKVYVVTDGASSSDCTVGSGSSASLCRSSGSAWVALGGSGGAGDVTDVGDCTTGACFTDASGSGTQQYFKNATSGSITLKTVAGALGTRTISLPAETGTACTTGSVCSGYQASGSYLVAADIDTSAELAAILTNETGTGLAVFATSPVFTTPNIGSATGSISGNAGTATALAANGANCSAGNYALGVDASGAAESCTAVTSSLWHPQWSALAFDPAEHTADAIPPPSKTLGTNVDTFSISYDDTALECRTISFVITSDIGSGDVTFYWEWWSATATSGNVIWDIRYDQGKAAGVSWDSAALTTKAASASAVQGTVKQISRTTVTETIANLGWANGDTVLVEVCRNGASGSDTMVGDAELKDFGMTQ